MTVNGVRILMWLIRAHKCVVAFLAYSEKCLDDLYIRGIEVQKLRTQYCDAQLLHTQAPERTLMIIVSWKALINSKCFIGPLSIASEAFLCLVGSLQSLIVLVQTLHTNNIFPPTFIFFVYSI